MSDTPMTDDRIVYGTLSGDDSIGAPWVNAPFARQLERELNAANERIKSLIEERDRASRLSDWKWNLRGEFESLLGTDEIEEGIKAVKEMKDRIKRLEEAGNELAKWADRNAPVTILNDWTQAKEAKP